MMITSNNYNDSYNDTNITTVIINTAAAKISLLLLMTIMIIIIAIILIITKQNIKFIQINASHSPTTVYTSK